MSILDQIEEIKNKKILNLERKYIEFYSCGKSHYLLAIVQADYGIYTMEHFESMDQMANWLNRNGWEINILHKS